MKYVGELAIVVNLLSVSNTALVRILLELLVDPWMVWGRAVREHSDA